VLAFDRRELRAFLEAVQKLPYHIAELLEQIDRLKALATPRPRRKASAEASAAGDQADGKGAAHEA
jgi:hypothetical protein